MLNDNELFMVSGASADAGHVAKVAGTAAGATAGGLTVAAGVSTAVGVGVQTGSALGGVLAGFEMAGLVCPPAALIGLGVGAVAGLIAWAPWD